MRPSFVRFGLLLLAAATTTCYRGDRDAGDAARASLARRADAVLIAKSMYGTDSAALLITDPKAINELADLVADNPHRVEHACGYHWLIVFRDRTGQVATYAHNEDCEKYQSRNGRVHSVLRAYFDQIKRRPSHFLYNVRVPTSLAPDDIMARSKTGPETVFFLNGVDLRLPRLRVEISAVSTIPDNRADWDHANEANLQVATKKLEHAIAVIRKTNPALRHSRLDNRKSSFGGGEIEHSVESTIYFPYGTSISDDVVPPDARVLEKVQPANFIIQVVATTRSPEAVGQMLTQSLGAGVRVAAYPDAPTQ